MSNDRNSECYHCNARFDAASSRWCDCVVRSRSLVCPACGLCSCDAPPEWKVTFGTYNLRTVSGNRGAAADEPANDDDTRPLVLVVDDHIIVQTIVREGLSPEFRVMTAKDGVEGFELAKAHLPDVVITDALMPKLDGRELCRNIKLYPPTADIKVVIMSALYRTKRQENEAIDQFRADAFLRKPVTIAKLKETIYAMLQAPAQAPAQAARELRA